MAEIHDVEIVEGEREFEFPCIVIDADFARRALEAKELPFWIDKALSAVELSGRRVAVLRGSES